MGTHAVVLYELACMLGHCCCLNSVHLAGAGPGSKYCQDAATSAHIKHNFAAELAPILHDCLEISACALVVLQHIFLRHFPH